MGKIWRQAKRCFWTGLWFLFVGLSPAISAEYTVEPSIDLRETYDDNVFFKNSSDFEHKISPELSLSSRTENMEVEAVGHVDISEYQRLNEFDTFNQQYDLSLNFQASPHWQLGFSGNYIDDYTFHKELEDSGILADRSRRKRSDVTPFVSYSWDTRNTLRTSYSFNKANHDLATYNDYRVHGGNAAWYHLLTNERTTLIFSVGASDAKYKEDTTDDTEQTTYRGLVGFEHRVSESSKLSLMGGAHHTESEYDWTRLEGSTLVTTREKDDDTGFLVDGSMEWYGERYSLTFNINRDISQSIHGENITRDKVSGRFKAQWNEALRSTLAVACRRNETDGLRNDFKRQGYSISPTVAYRLYKGVNLSLGYMYNWTENEISDVDRERNRVFLNLSMNWPILLD